MITAKNINIFIFLIILSKILFFSEETEGGNPYGCVYTSTTKWSDVDIENITSIKTDGMTIPISVKYVIIYKLPTAPEKEGYNFTGWYTDEACTNKYTGTTVIADTALYAGYEKKTFTVTLNTDGATETTTVEYNEAASLPTKTRTGYNFLGWYLPDGTKYDGQAVTSDLTLTAKFEVIMLKVRFFVDGVEYKTIEVLYGSKFSEAVEKASLKQSSVKSVILSDIHESTEQAIEVLTSDVKAEVEIPRSDSIKPYLLWICVGAAAVVITVGIIACIAGRKRK